MRQLAPSALRFLRNEAGPTAVEYAFMAVLVIVVCILAIVALGTNTSGVFKNDAQKITNNP
ncbi:MAG TPA: Flp family type IVb pilin [Gemmataceae bacterium]|jgi:pilus assembly protein Flp/PilA|nr:Flp family type IVb pilin [Gemmataceae bacterium]